MNGFDLPGSTAVAEAYLMPGAMQISATPLRVVTILGSCVALCLFDAVAGVGGINHFLLPGAPPANDPEPLRWSDSACLALRAGVVSGGAQPGRLQVKLFGGAHVGGARSPGSLQIGERNVVAALGLLNTLRLPAPVATDLGGDVGRKLVFETHTGRAWVRTLAPDAS